MCPARWRWAEQQHANTHQRTSLRHGEASNQKTTLGRDLAVGERALWSTHFLSNASDRSIGNLYRIALAAICCNNLLNAQCQLRLLWFAFGFPAFAAVTAIFWLMIARPQVAW